MRIFVLKFSLKAIIFINFFILLCMQFTSLRAICASLLRKKIFVRLLVNFTRSKVSFPLNDSVFKPQITTWAMHKRSEMTIFIHVFQHINQDREYCEWILIEFGLFGTWVLKYCIFFFGNCTDIYCQER